MVPLNRSLSTALRFYLTLPRDGEPGALEPEVHPADAAERAPYAHDEDTVGEGRPAAGTPSPTLASISV